jgi:ActR/RegA family two-component response regulator
MGTTTAINTEKLGRLTWTQFRKLVKAHGGNQSAAARELGVSPGTFRKWGERLRAQRASV